MNQIIEAFGYEECLRLAKYPDNCNFNLKTKHVKYENASSTFGEFVGYVSVFDVRVALSEYQKQLLNTTTSKAMLDIVAERYRQQEVKMYSNENDDQYVKNELLLAANSYLGQVISYGSMFNKNTRLYKEVATPELFPWDNVYWKPKNPREDLIRVAALVVAEIERLDRL